MMKNRELIPGCCWFKSGLRDSFKMDKDLVLTNKEGSLLKENYNNNLISGKQLRKELFGES